MYKTAYADEAGASVKTLRDNERGLIQQSLDMLEAADQENADPMKGTEAIAFTRRLWMLLMEDLSQDGNALPTETRASLISIGLWILRESDDIRLGKSSNYRGLIDVSTSIRDGLK
jgi:flagellar protein FlaF